MTFRREDLSSLALLIDTKQRERERRSKMIKTRILYQSYPPKINNNECSRRETVRRGHSVGVRAWKTRKNRGMGVWGWGYRVASNFYLQRYSRHVLRETSETFLHSENVLHSSDSKIPHILACITMYHHVRFTLNRIVPVHFGTHRNTSVVANTLEG